MDWSQYLYVSALALAVLIDRGRLSAIMVANFAATAAFSSAPQMVAVADMVTIAVLLFIDARARIIAALFVTMQPVYFLGGLFDVQNATTYTIVDCIAYLQLAVVGRGGWGMGRGGWGMGRGAWAGARLRLGRGNSAPQWRDGSISLARNKGAV
ncbi:MAG: hypothetical protein WBB85_16835, partial [Albidovulum sp.]|uniref:hypothetical protein n=1 Tax=Albidovulum sp. TaxID=1872424 RepID=UPI003CA2152E